MNIYLKDTSTGYAFTKEEYEVELKRMKIEKERRLREAKEEEIRRSTKPLYLGEQEDFKLGMTKDG